MSTDGNFILTEPVKYSLCSDVFVKKNHNNEWDKIDQQLTDSAIKQWRKRFAACVSARGGHIQGGPKTGPQTHDHNSVNS